MSLSAAIHLAHIPERFAELGQETRMDKANEQDHCQEHCMVPGKSDVVCSEHFVDKRPTLENPNPVLNLGYEKPAKKPRRELHRRQLSPAKRKDRE